MTQHTFLVEIGTEEIPSKILRTLAESFCTNFRVELDSADINYGDIRWFATPRRLALKVLDLNSVQNDKYIEKCGPSIYHAFDSNSRPTKAAQSWASRCGIKLSEADRLKTDHGEWLIYRAVVKGQAVEDLMCSIVSTAIAKIPISKMMRWGAKDIQFIRPVHTVTMLLDEKIIPGIILGIASGRIIRGHRFIGQSKIILKHANHYPRDLFELGKVIADYDDRKSIIRRAAVAAAKQINGVIGLNDHTLEEVTSLVEWPVVHIANLKKNKLSVPAEALVSTIMNSQKYFPIYNLDGILMPQFVFVANIESKNPHLIVSGNEKVIQSRLSDAEFFFNADQKHLLIDYLPRLNTVLFHKHLGTLLDKSNRIKILSHWIATLIGANAEQAARAGLLSKCDLMTKMVFEFPDIQGVIGMHYAHKDGEPKLVALAQKEHYLPRFSGDDLPTTSVSCSVAVADKMDTIVGILGINEHYKSNKDPFALRRAALGILRIIIEKKLSLDLLTLTKKSATLYRVKLTNQSVVTDTINFILSRCRAWYQEHGYSIDIIKAVMARRPTRPVDFDSCIRALNYLRMKDFLASLVMTNKRLSKILSKSNIIFNETFDTSVLKEPEEIKLAAHIKVLEAKLKPLLEERRYEDALIELSSLNEPIDIFFKNVTVMTEDDILRINRLNILYKLRKMFLTIADISLLQ